MSVCAEHLQDADAFEGCVHCNRQKQINYSGHLQRFLECVLSGHEPPIAVLDACPHHAEIYRTEMRERRELQNRFVSGSAKNRYNMLSEVSARLRKISRSSDRVAKNDAISMANAIDEAIKVISAISQELTIPAAEYVPAIGEQYPRFDKLLGEKREVISMQSYSAVCCICGVETGDKCGIPVATDGKLVGLVVSNEYDGEWAGKPACQECFDDHSRGRFVGEEPIH